MAKRTFDLLVIGSGPGGYVAAIRASQLGLSTAIVEKDATLGGTCLNVGCIPSKVLLDSSELYAQVSRGLADHGIRAGPVSVDLAALMRRKEAVVGSFTRGVATLMEANHVAVFHGTARLVLPTEVEVTRASGVTARPGGVSTESLQGRAIILATGSVPIELPSLPFDGRRIVSSTEALSFEAKPGRLLVVGAGAVGLELGSVWKRLGSEVTILELTSSVLPGWDAEVGQSVQRLLAKQGLTIHTGARVSAARVGETGVALSVEGPEGERKFEGDIVLVAVGRKPCTQGLGLQELGVKVDPKSGRVIVDERLRTSVPGIYAIGDLVEGPMLAHKASEEGIAAAEAIAGKAGLLDRSLVPSVVYTAPEAASVGASEEALRARGVRYVSGSFVFRANGRALALGRPEGFVKILADAESDRLLGVHIVGPLASDLIAEAVAVMAFGGSAEDIARTVHAHPSLPEAVREAALAAGGWPINAPPRRSAGVASRPAGATRRSA